MKKSSEAVKFWYSLLIVTFISTPIEALLLKEGLRAYASNLEATFSGITIPLLNASIEILLAVPIIAALVLSFYKYVSKA